VITENPNIPKLLSFEELWAVLQDTDRIVKETALERKNADREIKEIRDLIKETDCIVKETALKMKETDLQLKETAIQMKETDRQMKETDRKIGELGGRFGELVEHIVAPNLLDKFNKLGFRFGKIGTNVAFKDPYGKFIAEADALLENGDAVMVVEVKSKLTVTYVRDHIARMEKLRAYSDEHGDKRKLFGAVAAAVVPHGVREFVFKNGLYLVEQSGDTLKIDVPEGFVPHKW
jgi:hypothetical protein